MWLVAMVLIGTYSSTPVVGLRRVTRCVIPAASKTSLIASLYFCWDINGSNRPSLTFSRCLSMMNCALSDNGTRIVPGRSSAVLEAMYSTLPLITLAGVTDVTLENEYIPLRVKMLVI